MDESNASKPRRTGAREWIVLLVGCLSLLFGAWLVAGAALVAATLTLLPIAFIGLCVWLTVRIINRRERWAKRAGLVVICHNSHFTWAVSGQRPGSIRTGGHPLKRESRLAGRSIARCQRPYSGGTTRGSACSLRLFATLGTMTTHLRRHPRHSVEIKLYHYRWRSSPEFTEVPTE